MKEFSFCVSMSTIPSRIGKISEIIDNLNKQTLKPDGSIIFIILPLEKGSKSVNVVFIPIFKLISKIILCNLKNCDIYN